MTFLESIDALHERARKETGLDDFGDPSYRIALEVLLGAYDREARLGAAGLESTRETLVGCLVSRLHSNTRLAEHPECLEREIDAPLIIMGLPRTGTTALHKLLAADPESQALEYWLGCQPDVRPPRSTWPAHPGYRRAAAALARVYAHAPEVESIHSMQPDEADECRLLFLQDFLGLTFSSNATLPTYQEWLLEHDMRRAYRRYRDNLKLIGAAEPEKRWVLKNSSHLWAMEALVAALPSARLVQTHRDPVELIPSISSLVYRMRRISEPDIRKDEVGRQQLDVWSRILEKNMASRASIGRAVLDIHFETFRKDPIATYERIADHYDFASSRASVETVRAWAGRNRPDTHPPHRYSAEEYGLTDESIARRFRDYIDWEREIRRAG